MEIPAVKIPACLIGYKSTPIKFPGEIHCLEYYKCIKDVLLLINRWVDSVYSPFSKLHIEYHSLFVEAKLYAYKNDNSLFKKWCLEELCPLFNPNVEFLSDGVVKLIFKFENMKEDNKPMYDFDKYIKEYKDRNNKCEFCTYHNLQGGRCYMCKNHDWFVQDIDLTQYVIKRVTEDSEKEFKSSKDGEALNGKVYRMESVYNDYTKYVHNQKEFLDRELEERYKELTTFQKEYERAKDAYISDKIYKAFKSLHSMLECDKDD